MVSRFGLKIGKSDLWFLSPPLEEVGAVHSGFRVFRDRHYKILITPFISVAIYVQTERCITHFSPMFLAYFVILKVS